MIFSSLWVKSITIEGDSSVSEKELRAAMILKEPWLFGKSKFFPEILNGDIDAIKTVYLKHGFLNPEISSEYDIDSTGPVNIRLSVIEGRQTCVGSLGFIGNNIFKDEELVSFITTKDGLPFNPLALEDDYLTIINRYDDLGYHDIMVTSSVSISDSAIIEYRITEGDRVFISDVAVEPSKPMNEKRLKSAIGLKAGELLTTKKVIGARRRLYDLNIFSRVRVKEESLPNGRRLRFKLEAKRPLDLGARIGYSTLDGPKTRLSCEHRNLFRSLRRIGIISKFSFNEIGFEVNYRDPITSGNWLEHGIGFRIAERQEIGYQIDRLGGYGILIPEPFSIRYDLERIRISNVEIDTLVMSGTEWLRTLAIGFNIDTRNNLIRPTRGLLFSDRLRLSGILPEATSNFIQDELLFRLFIPWRNTVIGVRSDLGLARPISPSTEIPIHSRFFLGGATTIRGYGERMIGPKDSEDNPLGGERYILFSLEERIPIFWQFAGVSFIDCGSLEPKLYDKNLSFKVGIGFGLRLYTPLGPIRLDYGRNLDGSGAFHFAIGEAF